MVQKRCTPLAVVIVVFLSSLACQITPGTQPTIEFPTPNLTMTAFFSPTDTEPVIINPTDTQPVVQTVIPTTAIPPTETATLEPESTNTKPVPTIPSRRPGTSTEALYVSTAPTIDGGWGEWTATAYPMKTVVFGKANWSGADDLEASYRVAWDNQYLYIAVKVIDEKYVQNATGDNIYKGDSVELLLDVNLEGDYYSTQLSQDDFQLGIAPGKGDVGSNVEAFLWFPRSLTGGRSDIKIGAIKADGLYRVEFAVPWSLFGITPVQGTHFGFAVSVSDNDNPNKNEQQTMVSSAPGRNLLDPTTWGDLILVK